MIEKWGSQGEEFPFLKKLLGKELYTISNFLTLLA